MLSGRAAELNYLREFYYREGSQIVVVYGQKNIGKTALLQEFMADKPSCYYLARSCSQREQIFQWGREIGYDSRGGFGYEDILTAVFPETQVKRLLIIDEFQNLIKSDSTFIKTLSAFLREHPQSPMLCILCSSSVGFVESSMLEKLGEDAFSLSGLLKIKELHCLHMQKIFTGFTEQQCLEIYAVLGGAPGLWEQLESSNSVKENIIRHIIPDNSFLAMEAGRIINAQLRETNVYNTILACLASGMHKLNALYRHTGFSRAKLSVYLKNLMELEIVEKSSEQAGTYRIANRYIHFYYTFIYPNLSYVQTYLPQDFYEAFIEEHFDEYVASYWNNSY